MARVFSVAKWSGGRLSNIGELPTWAEPCLCRRKLGCPSATTRGSVAPARFERFVAGLRAFEGLFHLRRPGERKTQHPFHEVEVNCAGHCYVWTVPKQRALSRREQALLDYLSVNFSITAWRSRGGGSRPWSSTKSWKSLAANLSPSFSSTSLRRLSS